MKFSSFFICILFSLISNIALAQFTPEAHVSKGIEHHDNGRYDEAIDSYEKALVIDPGSALVNYELALTYFTKGDYKKAIKYANQVLKKESHHATSAYVIKGNALDMMGKTKKSIKVFKEGIAKEDHYLLHFNLALNYFKLNDLENAELNAINAIYSNPNHTSSHLMLAHINNNKYKRIQAILSSHFFLLLEPNSGRSTEAHEILMSNFGGNVSMDKDDPTKINITISGDMDADFGAEEMMISLLQASNLSDENKGKTKEQLFFENSESLFKMLGESKEDNNEGIYKDLYVSFFDKLVESPHFETYMHYIKQSFDESSKQWLENNDEKLQAFSTWLNEER